MAEKKKPTTTIKHPGVTFKPVIYRSSPVILDVRARAERIKRKAKRGRGR